jgi:hypothetical protein
VNTTEFLRAIVAAIEGAGIPYMVTGSLVSSYYAIPRSTQDVDVVIDPTERSLHSLVDSLLAAGFYVDREAALEAWNVRGQFNVIDAAGGWKADLIVRKDRPFSEAEFERRGRSSLLGIEVALARVEDVLLAKLEWSKLGDSELQRRDVAQILERQRARLDLGYVEHWVRQLGLEEEWEEAVRRATAEP